MTLGSDFENGLSDFVRIIVCGLVDNREAVRVNVSALSSRYIVEIHTSQDDIGQMIGRNGSIIKSVRMLIDAHAGKYGKTVTTDYATEHERPPARKVRA